MHWRKWILSVIFLLRMLGSGCEYIELLSTENELRQQTDSINHFADKKCTLKKTWLYFSWSHVTPLCKNSPHLHVTKHFQTGPGLPFWTRERSKHYQTPNACEDRGSSSVNPVPVQSCPSLPLFKECVPSHAVSERVLLRVKVTTEATQMLAGKWDDLGDKEFLIL